MTTQIVANDLSPDPSPQERGVSSPQALFCPRITRINTNFLPQRRIKVFGRKINAFVLSPTQWGEKTNAIGLVVKSGRYGGTFAHRDIAFEFASWISVEFKLYLT